MKSKVCTRAEIMARFHDGQTVAVGGQANHGAPNRLIDCLVRSGARDLTVVSIDSGDFDCTVGRLVHSGQVKKLITTHIGKNPETVSLLDRGGLEVELVPMGTLIERLRCGGMGLGGVLTKTGLGTVVAEGKQVVEANGERYLLETALRTDVSLVRARRGDPMGNLAYRGTSATSNPIIATCADLTIAEPDFLMELGELTIDQIATPGVFVDLVLGEGGTGRG